MKIKFLKNIQIEVAVTDGFFEETSFKKDSIIDVLEIIPESNNFSLIKLSSNQWAVDVKNDSFHLI